MAVELRLARTKISIYAPYLKSVLKAREHSILHPERIFGNAKYRGILRRFTLTGFGEISLRSRLLARVAESLSGANFLFARHSSRISGRARRVAQQTHTAIGLAPREFPLPKAGGRRE